MITSASTKKHGLKILKGVKVALKSIVLDFEEDSTQKPHDVNI